jgi:hypothetical protein
MSGTQRRQTGDARLLGFLVKISIDSRQPRSGSSSPAPPAKEKRPTLSRLGIRGPAGSCADRRASAYGRRSCCAWSGVDPAYAISVCSPVTSQVVTYQVGDAALRHARL